MKFTVRPYKPGEILTFDNADWSAAMQRFKGDTDMAYIGANQEEEETKMRVFIDRTWMNDTSNAKIDKVLKKAFKEVNIITIGSGIAEHLQEFATYRDRVVESRKYKNELDTLKQPLKHVKKILAED